MVSRILQLKYQLLLVAISGLLLFSSLGKVEVNIMEARNFTTAREMVQNKEYLLTTLNGEPRYQKPPLPTWLTAISGMVFGFDSVYGLRVPVALVTILLVLTFFYFSRVAGLSPLHSFNNGLILITSFYIFWAGRDNQWDMYAHSFMLVGILFLWKLLQLDSKQLLNSLLSGLFIGLSFLSKGPVSMYVLLLPFLVSYWVVYRINYERKTVYIFAVLFVGLIIGLFWFLYVRFSDPESFKVIAVREASNWKNYEVKPFYYYWNFFLQSGLWAIPSLIALSYPYMKKRVSNLKGYRFFAIWTVLSLVLLSIIPEKKVRYLVPMLIPLALTTGYYIEYLLSNYNNTLYKLDNILVSITFEIIACVGLSYPFVLLLILKKEGVMENLLLFTFSTLLVYLASYVIIKGLINKNFRKVFYGSIGLFALLVIGALPMSDNFFRNPQYSTASNAKLIAKELGIKTYRLSDLPPEIVWNYGEVIPLIDTLNLPKEKQFGLMVDVKDSLSVQNQFQPYRAKKLYRINMHYRVSKKTRLIKDFYLLTKN